MVAPDTVDLCKVGPSSAGAHRSDLVEDQHGVDSCTLIDSGVAVGIKVGLQFCHNPSLVCQDKASEEGGGDVALCAAH